MGLCLGPDRDGRTLFLQERTPGLLGATTGLTDKLIRRYVIAIVSKANPNKFPNPFPVSLVLSTFATLSVNAPCEALVLSRPGGSKEVI